DVLSCRPPETHTPGPALLCADLSALPVMVDEHDGGEKQSGGDLEDDDAVRADRVRDHVTVTECVQVAEGDVACERLEAESRRSDQRADHGPPCPPPLAEPAEERSGDETADDGER